MRIIAGDFRRRQLFSPLGDTTRPMPDRVKESLFSMFGLRVKDAVVLDLFSGSGAVGLECLSRGAASCMFVDSGRNAIETIEKNVELCKAGDRAKVVMGDALGMAIVARAPRPLDLVFMDPPYPLVRDPMTWPRVKAQAEALLPLLVDNGFLILRTPWPFVLDSGGEEDLAPDAQALASKKFKPKAKERFKYADDKTTTRIARHTPRPTKDQASRGPMRREKLHELSLGDKQLDDDGFLDAAGELGTPGTVALDRDERGEWIVPPAKSLEEGRETAPMLGPGGVPLPPGFAEALAAQERGRPLLADLAMLGGRGPETHVYRKTAVHIYMKAQG
ncbi:MAG: RsmD family RNA methyltransferase [Phycisphaerales bacterium]|nr:RsmD family RNA methyltransferase [Phycisphaerales bacterium]